MLKPEDISRLITDDFSSRKKKRALEGQRYYDGDHDILKCRLFYYNADGKLVEDTTRSNVKIPHPFFTELADQLSSYMLSFAENPMQAKDTAEGLQEHLDNYFDDDFWSEINELLTGSYTKGYEYLYAYKNEEDRLAFQCADSIGVVEVRENDTDDKSKYVIYWYVDRIAKGGKKIKRIQVWDSKETTYYVQADGGKVELDKEMAVNPRPHVVMTDNKGQKRGYGLGYIPFWRLDYNKKQVSGLKPIKGLIDDYDIMECGLSNNLADFDTPLHVVKGFEGDNLDELQQNLKTKKVVETGEDGSLEIVTVDIPYQARQAKAAEDEKNIYRFGMGFNSSQVGDGNITNIVILSRYTLLELKASKFTTRLKKMLKDILKIVIEEINAKNKTAYKVSDVKMVFERSVMSNDTENITNEKVKAETQQIQINTVLNVATTLDDETVVRSICEILDIDYEEIKDKLPEKTDDLIDAQDELDSVVPEDDPAGGE